MVSEVRTLIFTDDELFDAMLPVMRRRGQTVPREQAHDVQKAWTKQKTMTVKIHFKEDDIIQTFVEDEIFSGLIVYCVRMKIPLPMHGAKDIDLRGGDIALIVRLG